MKLRDIFLVLFYITLHNVYVAGKSVAKVKSHHAGKFIHLHAGKKVEVSSPYSDSDEAVGDAEGQDKRHLDQKIEDAKKGADVLQSCLDNKTGNEIYRRTCLLDWLGKVDKAKGPVPVTKRTCHNCNTRNIIETIGRGETGQELSLKCPGIKGKGDKGACIMEKIPSKKTIEETKTDYPFVVSDGPKASIHPIQNSKIKIGNDHDEDLVDYYDEDDDGEDLTEDKPEAKLSSRHEQTTNDDDAESGDVEGMPSFYSNEHKGDSEENEADEDKDEDQEEKEETSGSASGNADSDYSGDSDYTKLSLGKEDKVKDKKLVEPTEKKLKKAIKKIRTKTFEFGVGELNGNNLPIVVPIVSKRPKESPDGTKDTPAAHVKEEDQAKEFTKGQDMKKDVSKGLLKDLVAPPENATVSEAPAAAPAAPPVEISVAKTIGGAKSEREKWIVEGVNVDNNIYSILNKFKNVQQKLLLPPAYPAVIGKLGVPRLPQATLRAPNQCLAMCLTSCAPHCDPGCCRSGFPLGKGVTAEILPIPEDLNKVIKDAGIGPGTTAQILPTPQNKKMLQQAGFGEGVTARIIPIPAGYTVERPAQLAVDSRSQTTAKDAFKIYRPNVTSTYLSRVKAKPNPAPQPANLNKETQLPPHPPVLKSYGGAVVLPPNIPEPIQVHQVQPIVPPPAPVQASVQALRPPPAAQFIPAAASAFVPVAQPPQAAFVAVPPVPAPAVAPAVPPPVAPQLAISPPANPLDTVEAASRDEGIKPSPNASPLNEPPPNAPNVITERAPNYPIPADPPNPIFNVPEVARIEQLPANAKNYDETSYAELLKQLPPNVAPDSPVSQPLSVTQTLSTLDVPSQAGRFPQVNMFFKNAKTQADPYQTPIGSYLEAYKRQEFKNYNLVMDDKR